MPQHAPLFLALMTMLFSTVFGQGKVGQGEPSSSSGPEPYSDIPLEIESVEFDEGVVAQVRVSNRSDQAISAVALEVTCIGGSKVATQFQVNDWAAATALPEELSLYPALS